MEAANAVPTPAPQTFPVIAGVEADESPSIAHLAAALAKAQGEMKAAEKDGFNPQYRTKFADLASVWEACREPLAKNGLAVLQRVSTTTDGVILTTILAHSSGEWVRDRLHVPVVQVESRDGKKQPWVHAMGSAITYARRYTLSALVGVAAADGEDDDGNRAASQYEQHRNDNGNGNGSRVADVKNRIQEKQASPPPAPSPWERIKEIGAKHGKDVAAIGGIVKGATGKSKPSELTDDDVEKVAGALKALVPATPPAAAAKPNGASKPIVDVAPGQTEEQALEAAAAKKDEKDVPF